MERTSYYNMITDFNENMVIEAVRFDDILEAYCCEGWIACNYGVFF